MRVYARDGAARTARPDDYDDFDDDYVDYHDMGRSRAHAAGYAGVRDALDVTPGDRIGAPLRRAWRRRLATGALVLALAGASGFLVLNPETIPTEWTAQARELVASLTAQIEQAAAPQQPAQRTVPLPSAGAPAPAPEPQPRIEPALADIGPPPQAPPLPPQATEAKMAEPKPEVAKPYTEPPAAPADTLRKRAVAIGLHPELSRAVLEKLSAEDMSNVAQAIKTALKETPDDGVHTWPKPRKADQALIKVHFVAGAPAECRRYVVTITKDRWESTALPVEKCGAAAGKAKRI